MDFGALIDWQSACIVAGGTVMATLLRSGYAELLACVRLVASLGCPRFCERKARARLAPGVTAIQRNGIYRASLPRQRDRDLQAALDALIRHRSLHAMTAAHKQSCSDRRTMRQRGARLIHQASELAPVFGLAGTLIALSQPPDPSAVAAGLAAAVSGAVLTTLYGLMLAHMVLLPLARLLERRAERDDAERQAVIDWLHTQLRDTMPDTAPGVCPPVAVLDTRERAA